MLAHQCPRIRQRLIARLLPPHPLANRIGEEGIPRVPQCVQRRREGLIKGVNLYTFVSIFLSDIQLITVRTNYPLACASAVSVKAHTGNSLRSELTLGSIVSPQEGVFRIAGPFCALYYIIIRIKKLVDVQTKHFYAIQT